MQDGLCCFISADMQEAIKIDKMIEKKLKKNSQKNNQEYKLLLLGKFNNLILLK